jgi:hypothetical protein
MRRKRQQLAEEESVAISKFLAKRSPACNLQVGLLLMF